jgi:ubiquinone/menaquinone biosynthesis C-methylase UbiE
MTLHAPVPSYGAAEPLQPPRLRVVETSTPNAGVAYDSEDYAMLNRPLETERHARRVMRFLCPQRHDRLLEAGGGRGWLTGRMQQLCPATWGVGVNPRSIAHAVTGQMIAMDAVSLQFGDAQFDHASSFHAIEHVVDAEGRCAR